MDIEEIYKTLKKFGENIVKNVSSMRRNAETINEIFIPVLSDIKLPYRDKRDIGDNEFYKVSLAIQEINEDAFMLCVGYSEENTFDWKPIEEANRFTLGNAINLLPEFLENYVEKAKSLDLKYQKVAEMSEKIKIALEKKE